MYVYICTVYIYVYTVYIYIYVCVYINICFKSFIVVGLQKNSKYNVFSLYFPLHRKLYLCCN